MPLLSFRDVSVTLGGNRVIHDVSFDIERGDIVTVIGPNGSGKSTLIRATLGLVPYKGTILFEGKPVERHLSAIGYVPQRFDFDKTFPLSVREFLNLFPSHAKSNERASLCKELRITSLLSKTLGTLSGGQLQRVLMAQALLKNPQLLILDEPTSGVDVEGVKNFYEIVEHLNKEHHVTIILVSHELTMVYRFATKVVCLNQNMVCFGDPTTALTKDVVERLYGENMKPRGHAH
ncbi:MAG: metal ABC transporter ATP-binding protein [Patescibacteria group bacterium]